MSGTILQSAESRNQDFLLRPGAVLARGDSASLRFENAGMHLRFPDNSSVDIRDNRIRRVSIENLGEPFDKPRKTAWRLTEEKCDVECTSTLSTPGYSFGFDTHGVHMTHLTFQAALMTMPHGAPHVALRDIIGEKEAKKGKSFIDEPKTVTVSYGKFSGELEFTLFGMDLGILLLPDKTAELVDVKADDTNTRLLRCAPKKLTENEEATLSHELHVKEDIGVQNWAGGNCG